MNSTRHITQSLGGPLLHGSGSILRERERKDIEVVPGESLQQPNDPLGQHFSLTRSGRGNHKVATVDDADDVFLLGG
jgi:hypothetical protein